MARAAVETAAASNAEPARQEQGDASAGSAASPAWLRAPALACFIAAAGLGACSKEAAPEPAAPAAAAPVEAPPIGATELAALKRLSPLPALPPDPTNRFADDPKARALGQALFFDKGFAGPLKVDSDLGKAGEAGKLSCQSCHSGPALDDRRSQPRTVALGADFHTRNSPPLVNSAYYRWTNWAGRFSAQWELPPVVAENPAVLNSSRLLIAHRVFDHYRKDYEAVFGPLEPALGSNKKRFPAQGKPKPAPSDKDPKPADGVWEAMAKDDQRLINQIFVNYGKALQAYIRALLSKDAPFDRYIAGDAQALSAAAQRGAALFVGKAACSACHSSPHFSDDAFHNLGVPQVGDKVPAQDDGRFKDVPPLLNSPLNSAGAFSDDVNTGRLSELSNPMPESAKGAFRTANLRGCAESGPYMHSGQLATLEEVVDFYDKGGGTPVSGSKDALLVPLGLSAEEKQELIEFLKSLSGAAIAPELLEDTSPKG